MESDQMDAEAHRATLIYGINDVIRAAIMLGLDAARDEIAAERDRMAEDSLDGVDPLEPALWHLIDEALLVAEGCSKGYASATLRAGGPGEQTVHFEWQPETGPGADFRAMILRWLDGPAADAEDNACPEDPDGLHHVGCGCDHANPDDGRAA